MCGIAGGTNLDESILDAMIRKVSHRGPDNISTEIDQNVYLAHSRLSIIDLSKNSNQPLWDTKRRVCIVFNGEIYNYKTLRKMLIAKGVEFNSEGDAEVIVNLYLLYGEECLAYLDGIFAFCIWDKNKEELFLARDQFGTKPLYYTHTADQFAFASEMKSLLSIPSLKRELNNDALFRTLIFLYSPGEDTLLSDVKKLKPGHFMVVQNNLIQKCQSYWAWPEYKPSSANTNEHIKSVYESIDNAVSKQLVADVPVGAFLSGGLDSSLLVALAKKRQDIQCFTIDANSGADNDGFEDDLPYAKRVAEHLDVELDVLKVTPDITRQLPEMIYHLDELQADPAPLNVKLICEEAKKKGISVLLSGAGGDDLFSGYRRHIAIQLEKYWSWMPKWSRSCLKSMTSSLPKSNSLTRRISKAFAYADLENDERLLSYFYWIDPSVAKMLFKSEIREKLADEPMQDILNQLANLQTSNSLEKMLFLERSYFLVDHNLNYTDKMSMATGVEVRVPFLDKDVANAASNVPASLKQKGKTGKWILKKAAEACLPESIIYRPKSGFGAPLRHWLKTDLSSMVDELLGKTNIETRNVFDADAIRALIDADRAGKEDYSYTIFALLCFEIWCQKFLDE